MKKAIETKGIHTVTSIELSFGQLRPKQCLNNFYKITKKIEKFQKNGFLARILVNRRPNFGPKVHKRLFSPQKWSKRPSQRAKFWPWILILEVIYQPFELKIHPKVCLFRQKIDPSKIPMLQNTFKSRTLVNILVEKKYKRIPMYKTPINLACA